MWRRYTLLTALVAHAGLLAWSASRHSPTIDELPHLTAGIAIWKYGRFDLYPVNPPLVKTVAAAPVFLAGPAEDWVVLPTRPGKRIAWSTGRRFAAVNGPRTTTLCAMARWACIPFSIFGALVCWSWARELYGDNAGLAAAVLWCFSPNILAHGALITPDAAAAALGAAAAFTFWKWLHDPTWTRCVIAGIVLGIAELTKMTWIVLFALWLAVWIAWRLSTRHQSDFRTSKVIATDQHRKCPPSQITPAPFIQLMVILFSGWYVLNAGYGFAGTFTRLGEYRFVSEALSGADAWQDVDLKGGNRFTESWMAHLPVPLPKDYLKGVDIQKRDFEQDNWSYLAGEWRRGGWWYYYLYGMLVKMPLGTWGLLLLAVYAALGRHAEQIIQPPRQSCSVDNTTTCTGGQYGIHTEPASAQPGTRLPWRHALLLCSPGVVVFILVSSQTALNQHCRYVLPCFPFLFIALSSLFKPHHTEHTAAPKVLSRKWVNLCPSSAGLHAPQQPRWLIVAGWISVLASVGSSLLVYPHSLSYCNFAVGGPLNGPAHLLHSNIDWGQDLLHLKHWKQQHPGAEPFYVAYHGQVEPRHFGIDAKTVPPTANDGRLPGWYALSVNVLYNRHRNYSHFQKRRPVATAGYSIYIYHITLEEANRVRRELGLPVAIQQKVPPTSQ